MNSKRYTILFFLFSCIVAAMILTHYKVDIEKEGIKYYVTKQTLSSTSEESYIKYYNMEENENVVFSEMTDPNAIKGYTIMYVFPEKVINYAFDLNGKLSYKTTTTSDYGYVLRNIDSMRTGQIWQGKVTIETYGMENEQTFITYYDFETEVLSYEEIKVEAGKFKCYKIRCTTSTEYGGEVVRQINTLWYAPNLKIIVRGINTSNCECIECTSMSELIEYG